MKIIFEDYTPQTVKKYAKIALDYFNKTGMKKFKVNRVLFDFSLSDRPRFYAESQNTKYFFTIGG